MKYQKLFTEREVKTLVIGSILMAVILPCMTMMVFLRIRQLDIQQLQLQIQQRLI